MRSARTKAKILTAAVVPLLAASAAVAVSAPQASAAPNGARSCTHPGWSDKSGAKGTAKGAEALVRTGPTDDCGIVATVGTRVTLYYHCWVKNSSGNKWTHVRIGGTQIDGWVYNARLDDGGLSSAGTKC
ncbi:SH3 domain-containing protein [Streptomyces cinnamoneus]|uniref:SH3 domain-containing protein n=1 Tax=Streptomyces cinnamoneus TaxID=53446 RepID=UPI0034306ED6